VEDERRNIKTRKPIRSSLAHIAEQLGLFPSWFYGCETWSLTLREEYRLRVFENRVLRRIFGAKRDEIIGGWGKLHNEELHNL
jgi:hypothetical protein